MENDTGIHYRVCSWWSFLNNVRGQGNSMKLCILTELLTLCIIVPVCLILGPPVAVVSWIYVKVRKGNYSAVDILII